jgi:quinol monooxygenase YgiN
MYGLFGKLTAQPGRQPELLEIMIQAVQQVQEAPGCMFYIVNTAPEEPDAIVVIEIWESKQDHDNSLKDEAVKGLIAQAMPLIDGKPQGFEITPIHGKGLSNHSSGD